LFLLLLLLYCVQFVVDIDETMLLVCVICGSRWISYQKIKMCDPVSYVLRFVVAVVPNDIFNCVRKLHELISRNLNAVFLFSYDHIFKWYCTSVLQNIFYFLTNNSSIVSKCNFQLLAPVHACTCIILTLFWCTWWMRGAARREKHHIWKLLNVLITFFVYCFSFGQHDKIW